MIEYFEKFLYLFEDNTIFAFCAYTGSAVLVIQLTLNIFGFANTESCDAEISEARTFKCLSLQTLGGFFMMFGWTGITCQKQFNFQIYTSILLAFILGLCSAFIANLTFKIVKKIHSPGNTCSLDTVIGKEAFVYQRIPKGGVGKISVSFQHLTCEIDAISHTQEELPSFTRVQILKKKDDVTLVVIPI